MLAAMLAAVLLGLAAASRVAAATDASGVRIMTLVRPAPRFPATFHTARTFQLVGGRWSGAGRLQVRSSRDGHSWSRWVPFSTESPTWTDDARAVQVRRASGGTVRDLRISFITSPPQPVTPSVMPATTIRPPIITRAGWGANESWRRGPPSYAPALKMVFVHHTDTTNLYSCTSSAQIVRGIYAYHVKNNGWNDIGYNFLIDRCGHVFEGRYGGVDKPVIGAQTLGMNTGSAGIALIGTFTSSRPTTAAMTALERLIAWRLDVAHVNPLTRAYMISSGNEYFHPGQGVWLRAVSGHRDGSATTCPGAALYALVPAVAKAAYAIGLPKIFASRVYGHFVRVNAGAVQPLSITATFSHLTRWAARVLDPHGRTVAMRIGTGASMRWNWSGTAARAPGRPVPLGGVRAGRHARGAAAGRAARVGVRRTAGVGVRLDRLRRRLRPAGRGRQRADRDAVHDGGSSAGDRGAVQRRRPRRGAPHRPGRGAGADDGAVELPGR